MTPPRPAGATIIGSGNLGRAHLTRASRAAEAVDLEPRARIWGQPGADARRLEQLTLAAKRSISLARGARRCQCAGERITSMQARYGGEKNVGEAPIAWLRIVGGHECEGCNGYGPFFRL